MIKIIAGKHKNRLIPTIKKGQYRPSTSRLKAAIFSILLSGKTATIKSLADSHVLDLFCGSGNLGFEALSRGAKSAAFVDINPVALQAAKEFATLIGELDNSKFLSLNALRLPRVSNISHGYDIVFIDPPYHKNFAIEAVESVLSSGWLNPAAILVVELAKTDDLVIPANLENSLEVLMERLYNNSKLIILQIKST